FMNRKIGYVDVGALIPQRDPVGFGLKPCWMVDGDFVIMALAPQTLKHYLAAQGSQRPGVATHPDYVEAMAHLRQTNGQAGRSSSVFFNLGDAIAFGIDTAAPIMQSMYFADDMPLDMTQFPTTDVFRRHLFGLTALGSYTNTEMNSEIYSCTGYMPAIIGIGAGVGAATMMQARSSAAAEWEDWEEEGK
ncbi:MAG: hypothetical protein KDB53_02315, partial [Planctomycetes bacterium]|nr:hypothetical protein [Planctomycetota bacterium]